MTISLWVTVVCLAVTVVVQIVMGYLQRKQMRQNELFRVDPKVGLKPPPHPVTAFLRRHWPLFTQVPGVTFLLVYGFILYLRSHTADPGVPVAAGMVLLTLTMLNSVVDRLIRLSDRMISFSTVLAATVKRHEDLLRRIVQLLGKPEEISQSTRIELENLLVDVGDKKSVCSTTPGGSLS